MTSSTTALGWFENRPDDPEVVALREHLEAASGIQGLEILESDDRDRIRQVFYRDGYVVIGGVLDNEQIDFLAKGCEDAMRGNRGPR